MKRVVLTTLCTCLVALGLAFTYFHVLSPIQTREHVTVGFIFKNDESTPYTYNFSLARDELEKKYGAEDGPVTIYTRSNVLESETEDPLRELVRLGCDIIFLNGYSPQVLEIAPEYPDVQFCQVSYADMSGQSVPDNYHTFKGEIYQGRYVSGIAAGMKLRQLIDRGRLTAEQALVGYVAAFPNSEVISGYTAFLLGVRSVVPQAKLHVHYTQSWSNYSLEKAVTEALIQDGCVVISQHTDTIGPAVACEEAAGRRPVYYVGYNQSMTEIAPGSALTATRVNWTPYVTAAVEAVFNYRDIESAVPGNVHGNDISAGFDRGWVEMLDLNLSLAAKDTQARMDEVIDQFRRGKGPAVFQGDYSGVDPSDPTHTIDLRKGFEENAESSYPTFGYVLKDVITAE